MGKKPNNFCDLILLNHISSRWYKLPISDNILSKASMMMMMILMMLVIMILIMIMVMAMILIVIMMIVMMITIKNVM